MQKIERLNLDKFDSFKLKSKQQKHIIGGKDICTGGGYSLTSVDPDEGGVQNTYISWDSDVSENGVTYKFYNMAASRGDCFDDGSN